jgi:SpoVK/Ycf46/Vps4 family AAA+-type ATPase
MIKEGISDYVKRPLFPLRSGDLGIEPQVLEKNLNEAFELAARWNAIILLDEADVFLEERRRNELLRNSLVTGIYFFPSETSSRRSLTNSSKVFLRVLEYYEGIMFLTTNRIDAFDPAFRSRIHLSIKYYQLDWDCRYNLWSEFVKNGTSNEVDPSATDEAFLIRLADLELNGRQIRNTVRTAYALALSANKPLGAEHIETTLKAMNTFDQDSKDIARPSVSSGEEDWATSSRRPQKRRRVD